MNMCSSFKYIGSYVAPTTTPNGMIYEQASPNPGENIAAR
jgi:hypothetical protein